MVRAQLAFSRIENGNILQVDVGTLGGAHPDIVAMYRDVFSEARESGITSVLMNFEHAQFEQQQNASDVMEVLKLFDEKGWLEGLKVARMLKRANFVNDLIESYASALSLPIKNFDDKCAARDWLLTP